jgi:glutamate synthase domain-containing protein 3
VVGGLTDEERYNFSSLMSLLSEAESKLKQLYETLAKETGEPKLKSLLSDYDRNSSKRMEMMRRTRVESVVEFMLEPITGLRLAEPIAAIKTAIENQSLIGLEKAVTVERIISELYATASPKIMSTSADAGELLARLSRESMERADELEQYVKPR